MNKRMDVWVGEWDVRWTDGWMIRCMDIWSDEWTDDG